MIATRRGFLTALVSAPIAVKLLPERLTQVMPTVFSRETIYSVPAGWGVHTYTPTYFPSQFAAYIDREMMRPLSAAELLTAKKTEKKPAG